MRQLSMFGVEELRPGVREFVRDRLVGIELRMRARAEKRRRKNARRKGEKSAGGGLTCGGESVR